MSGTTLDGMPNQNVRKVSLGAWLKDHTQNDTALALGMTQGALSQMIRNKREIWILEDDRGGITAKEVRSVPAFRDQLKTA